MADQVVGVELAESGMRLVAAVSPERGARRWSTRLQEPPPATEAVEQIHALISRALDESGAASRADVAVGVAVGGSVDAARGVVRGVHLAAGWEDFPLAAALSERWGGPAAVLSTTQAAALAEARLGAGRTRGDLLYVLLGRSVTAGFVLEGRVYSGAHGRAGELAHWLVRPDGPRCSCGARGHLGPLASAQSLVRRMIGRAVDHPESNAAMLRISGGRAEAMTAEQVVRLAAMGDAVARAVLDDAIEALAPALANLTVALDPDAIVVGGPLATAGAGFLDPLGEHLKGLCQPFGRAPLLLAGELEPAAALVGAVVSARERRASAER
jgi:glucokinase